MNDLPSRDRLAAVLFYGVILLLAYLLYRVAEPFLVPLGWAAVLVVCFYPWHARLEARWGASRAAAVSTLAVTLMLIVPSILVMTGFLSQAVSAARAFQQSHAGQAGAAQLLERGGDALRQRLPWAANVDLVQLARQGVEAVGAWAAARAGTVLRNIAVFLFDLFVTIFAMFYLFRDAEKLLGGVRRALPFEPHYRERVMAEARDLISASVTSSLIVAAIHGVVGGIAFAALGIGAALFWGVMMAFLSLLPVLGAWMIWLPAAIWLFFNGQVWRAVILVVVAAVIVGIIDHFLRPALISGRSQLSGLLIFIGVVGGISVFGMLGVVLGPIIVATATSLLEVYTQAEPVGSR